MLGVILGNIIGSPYEFNNTANPGFLAHPLLPPDLKIVVENFYKNLAMKNYKYFNGEASCPFEDLGLSFWWRVEKYAYENGDEKQNGVLSSTMLRYLKNLMLEGDSVPSTSEVEFKKRARELYLRGVWSRSYITDVSFPLERVLNLD